MTDKDWPKISIVTPSYNQGEFLEETICSVLEQNYPNLEYIVIDGASTDNSVEIIKRYEKYIAYWISEKDKGQADAINKGFSKATGEIFAWLNSDDMYYPGTLHKVAQYWIANPSCHFLAGDGEIINLTGEKSEYYIKAKAYSFGELLRYHKGVFLPQPSVFFSREAFRKVNGLDASLRYALDVDLFFRIRKYYHLHYLPALLSKWRRHESAKTWGDSILSVKEAKEVVMKQLEGANILKYLYIRTGMNRCCALVICRRALSEYFNKNRRDAIKLLKEAMYMHPAILFSRICLNLILRLSLPVFIKKRLFKIVEV